MPHDAMNAWKFLSRSLAYYARSHFGTLMGACIASAVLTGALMVGDSVRGSLYQMAMVRLGKVDTAIVGNDRLFQEDLAQRMQDPTFAKVSPALQLPAVSALQGGDYRSNQSWLFWVKNTFWDMAIFSFFHTPGSATLPIHQVKPSLPMKLDFSKDSSIISLHKFCIHLLQDSHHNTSRMLWDHDDLLLQFLLRALSHTVPNASVRLLYDDASVVK